MKNKFDIALFAIFVLIASGAFSKGYFYSYVLAIIACVAIIVNEERYPRLRGNHLKKWLVLMLCGITFLAYYFENANKFA